MMDLVVNLNHWVSSVIKLGFNSTLFDMVWSFTLVNTIPHDWGTIV